jgi:hypothetical protein
LLIVGPGTLQFQSIELRIQFNQCGACLYLIADIHEQFTHQARHRRGKPGGTICHQRAVHQQRILGA